MELHFIFALFIALLLVQFICIRALFDYMMNSAMFFSVILANHC